MRRDTVPRRLSTWSKLSMRIHKRAHTVTLARIHAHLHIMNAHLLTFSGMLKQIRRECLKNSPDKAGMITEMYMFAWR